MAAWLYLWVKTEISGVLCLTHKNNLTKEFFAKHGMADLKNYEFGQINDIGSGFPIAYRNWGLAEGRHIAKECDKGRM